MSLKSSSAPGRLALIVAVALALYSLGALTIAATLARVRRIRRPAAGGTDSDPA